MAINFVTENSSNIFIVPMFEAFNEFRERHNGWLLNHIGEEQWRRYFESIVENMVAHMEYQNIGIPSYLEYCSNHLIDGLNTAYEYHPYKFIRFRNDEQKVVYLKLLAGFANHFFTTLQELDYYNEHGILKGAYQGIGLNDLYLALRPSLSPLMY